MNSQLQEYLQEDQKILVICSQPLDLDSLGSGLILKKYLESLGKSVSLVFPRKFTNQEKEKHGFLPFFSEIKDGDTRELFTSKQFDGVIFIDGTSLTQYYDTEQTRNQPPKLETYPRRVHIDHHLNLVDPLGKLTIRDDNIGSTAEVLLRYIIPLDFLDSKLATLAYSAIAGDTGNFQWAFTDQTFDLAAVLLRKGADVSLVIQQMFYEKPKEYFTDLCWVASRVKYVWKAGTTFLYLPKKLVQEMGWDKDRLEVIRDIYKDEIAKSVAGYDRGVVIEEKKDGWIKVSARGNTKNQINLPEVFKKLYGHGGGHFNAAGFEVEGKTIAGIKRDLIQLFSQQLKQRSD